jgi:hypothetical protein
MTAASTQGPTASGWDRWVTPTWRTLLLAHARSSRVAGARSRDVNALKHFGEYGNL